LGFGVWGLGFGVWGGVWAVMLHLCERVVLVRVDFEYAAVGCCCCHRALCLALRVCQVEQAGFRRVNVSDGGEVNNSLFKTTISEVTGADAWLGVGVWGLGFGVWGLGIIPSWALRRYLELVTWLGWSGGTCASCRTRVYLQGRGQWLFNAEKR
jgi:hypothetical protein